MYRAIQRLILFVVGLTLPMAGLSTKVEGYPLSPAKVATALLMILVAMQFALSSQRRFPGGRGMIWLLVFLVSLSISTVVTIAFGGLGTWMSIAAASRFFGLAAFYVMLIYVVRTRDDLALLFWSLVIGGAITAFPALLEVRGGTFLAHGERSSGLAGKPNKLGYELAICIPIAFSLYFTNRSLVRKSVLMGCVALMVFAILGSLSRSTFLALGVMWGLWVWRSRRLDTLKYVFPAVAVALLLALVMPQRVYDRIDSMVNPARREEDKSIQVRFDSLRWTALAFYQSPLVGIGVENYIPWIQSQPGGKMYKNSLHSGFFAILVNQGLLGFVPFMVLQLLSWWDYSAAQRLVRARRSRDDPELREFGAYALFLQVALAGALVGALTHPTADSKGWWMLMGLSATMVTLARQRSATLDAQLTTAPAPEPLRRYGFEYGSEVATAPR